MITFREPTRELPAWVFIRKGARYIDIDQPPDNLSSDDEFACVGLDVSDAEALLEVLLDICPNAKALAHNWLLEEQKREHLKGRKP